MIKELVAQGLTQQKISERFKISHQRVSQILNSSSTRNTLKTNCFKCQKPAMPSSWGKFHFCKHCRDKYFVRKAGSRLSGMDYKREIVRLRDKHTCQNCKMKWKFGTRRFDIHHLGGLCGSQSRTYDSSIDHLTTLCHKCHLNIPEVRKKMSNKSSPRPIKDKQYYLDNREMIYKKKRAWLKSQ